MVLWKGRKHRKMDVNLNDNHILGEDCKIVDKTIKTRLGLEFVETIECKKIKIRKNAQGKKYE